MRKLTGVDLWMGIIAGRISEIAAACSNASAQIREPCTTEAAVQAVGAANGGYAAVKFYWTEIPGPRNNANYTGLAGGGNPVSQHSTSSCTRNAC